MYTKLLIYDSDTYYRGKPVIKEFYIIIVRCFFCANDCEWANNFYFNKLTFGGQNIEFHYNANQIGNIYLYILILV